MAGASPVAVVEAVAQRRGTAKVARAYLEDFRAFTGADELMTVHQGRVVDDRITSLTLTAEAMAIG